ncbi:MAG: threonine ammonia-lyase [bacterium]|nr:threonine ammonia-lyase [bacterium]
METNTATYRPTVENAERALQRLKNIVTHTPLTENINLSDQYRANIKLKREDLQVVRSYKIRGAYNKISTINQDALENGVVCASAGNHAQGVALSCYKLKVKGTIYMPAPTPKQKVQQVRMFGKDYVDIVLHGDTFDDAYNEAIKFSQANNSAFVHPFDDEKVIEGQSTIGLEILRDVDTKIDYLFLPVGGGGLSSGVSSILKTLSPETKIIGVEPKGAPAMHQSLKQGEVVTLDHIDKFVDGAAVKKVGDLTFNICKETLDEVALVDEGNICTSLIKMYNENGIVLEPAGALTVAVLDQYKEEIKGKNVVCLLSGSNNDITRTEEIRERSLLSEGLKHYFLVRFPQRAGALKEFVAEVLGPEDDIVHFEYSKRTSREKGPAVVGIELKTKDDLNPLLKRMKERNFFGEYLNDNPDLFVYLV